MQYICMRSGPAAAHTKFNTYADNQPMNQSETSTELKKDVLLQMYAAIERERERESNRKERWERERSSPCNLLRYNEKDFSLKNVNA